MSDGTPTLDSATPEAPAPIEAEAPQPVDPGVVDPIDSSTVVPPVEDDLDEIEFDGDRYKVPKKLKDGFLMQSDYTRKTQEVAAQRKALETAQETVKQEAEAQRSHVQDVGRAMMINDQLAELDKIDWQALTANDPFKAQEMFQHRQLLKERRDSLISNIQTAEQQRSQQTQQEFAKRYAETNETLAKDIKGWNDDLAGKLATFARANGVSENDLRAFAIQAPLVKLLHKAFLGEQLVNTKQTAAQAAEPKVEPKPLVKVTGNGAKSAPSLADADMDTYVSLRKKQGFSTR